MGPMGHDIPNTVGVDQSGVEEQVQKFLPDYMAMGKNGMAEHAGHVAMGMLKGPANTLPMATGEGPYGPLEMGGMFTVVKVRDDQPRGDYRDPGWYKSPEGKMARRVSSDPGFGTPRRLHPYGAPAPAAPASPASEHQMDHNSHGM